MKPVTAGLVVLLLCGLGTLGAHEPPALKDDRKTLAKGQWRRPADKGPDWIRIQFKHPDKSELLLVVSVYSDSEAKKPLQEFGTAAELQEDKTKRFVYYGDDDNKITYRFKDKKLILEGKFTGGRDPRKVIDLSGEWVNVDPPAPDEKK